MYERIWNLAKEQGISIPALEEMIGVSQSTIGKWKHSIPKDALTVIPKIKTPTPRIKEIALSGDDLRESYQTFTRQERRAVWKSAIDRIDVDGDALTVTFRT